MTTRPFLYVPTPTAACCTTLPGVARRHERHARRPLPLVRSAMAGVGAALICLHIDTHGARHSYRSSLWRGDIPTGFIISDGSCDVSTSVLAEICASLSPIARDLASRWPDRARPVTIGFATDGHRILFSPDHPGCDGHEWLEQHLSGRSPCALIVDDGVPGMLEIISPMGKGQS